MRIEAPPRRRHRPSLTPLIDVVFLLLVFFMLVSSFVDLRAIRLAAPGLPQFGAGIEGGVLVRLLADGRLDLNGAVLTLDALERRLRALLARDPELRVTVQAQRSVRLQRMVDVLDRVRAAGARKLAVTRG